MLSPGRKPTATVSENAVDKGIEIVDADENSLTIEILVPALEVQDRLENGERYQNIKLKGYGWTSEVGNPLLPVKGILLALPEGAELDVKVLEAEKMLRRDCSVLPVPHFITEELDGLMSVIPKYDVDKIAYSANRFYPDRLVEVGECGYIRDLRVCQLRIQPVQYNPVKKILVYYPRIVVSVQIRRGKFHTPIPDTGWFSPKRNPFEDIYRNLVLNYNPLYLEKPSLHHHPRFPRQKNREYLEGESYKLLVEEDCLHRLDYEDLFGAGMNPQGIDPRTIKIFNEGEELDIHVFGEEDGILDTIDYLEFFGLKNRSEYSITNIYWFCAGNGTGHRMGERSVQPGDTLPVLGSFLEGIRFEEDDMYYSNVWAGEGKDHWFWEQLNAPTTRSYSLMLPDVADTAENAKLKICLRGKSGTSANPDHHTEIFLNGYLVADIYWDGKIEYIGEFTFPHSYLQSGTNFLEIRCPDDTGSPVDQIYFNWLEVEYWRRYHALGDLLRFVDSSPGANQFEISGFSDSDLILLDVTNPEFPIRLTQYSIIPEDSTYTIKFEDTIDQSEYIALTSARCEKPASIIEDKPSNLLSTFNSADYLIITHEDFCDCIQPLRFLRESEGLGVEVIEITDVYDEFSYGNFDPQAIKDFLTFAYYNWQKPAPVYVLLVGDATYDYKDNLGTGNINYVPTHLFVSQSDYTEVSSDNWFVDIVVEGDELHLPDMLIGRLSGKTTDEIGIMVNKVTNYENNLPDEDWRRNVLLVADNPDGGGDFESICDNFADNYIIPAGFDTTKVYLTRYATPGQCKNAIIENIDEGCVIVNFVGHGSIDIWAGERILTSADVPRLCNEERLPLLISMTCLNGFFHHATNEYCIAEEFHRAENKGSVACWCHSGLDYGYLSEILGEGLYGAFLFDNNYILGSAIAQAKIEYLSTVPYWWDQAEMLILFGDPALEMGFPGKPDLLPGEITFFPPQPRISSVDTVICPICNGGRDSVDSLLVKFSVGHPESSGCETIKDTTVGLLGAGESLSLNALWSVPDSEGTYEIFVYVDPANEIEESNEWNNIRGQSVTVVLTAIAEDDQAPSMRLTIDGRRVGAEIRDYDKVSSMPEIIVLISDESGIRRDGIRLTLNGSPQAGFALSPEGDVLDSLTLAYQSGVLSNGVYTLEITATDDSPSRNVGSVKAVFVVESIIEISNLINYPNPLESWTEFLYYLSEPAQDVSIKVYTVSGRLIKRICHVPAGKGFNQVFWDGRDEDGDRPANGVYLYKIIATNGDMKAEAMEKLVIMR